jgi:hypothetical protein
MSEAPQIVPENIQAITPKFWTAPLEFVLHALVGTFIFAIIAAAAVGIDLGVRALQGYGISELILYGFRTGEGALFATDLVLFGVFLFRTAKRIVQKL